MKCSSAPKATGEGFIVVDDLVDTGGTAKAIRLCTRKRISSPSSLPAGPSAGGRLRSRHPQDTWIEQPWDMGVSFVPRSAVTKSSQFQPNCRLCRAFALSWFIPPELGTLPPVQ